VNIYGIVKKIIIFDFGSQRSYGRGNLDLKVTTKYNHRHNSTHLKASPTDTKQDNILKYDLSL
jgi:hypothetical protein